MKRTLLILLWITLFGTSAAYAQAVMTMEKTSHHFGKFKENVPQTYVFKFTNTGNEPLVIHQAMSSCGCTVPQFTKTPIKPGEGGEISVTYNGKGKYPGHFKKGVTIRTNAKNALVRIYVEGDMEAAEEKK